MEASDLYGCCICFLFLLNNKIIYLSILDLKITVVLYGFGGVVCRTGGLDYEICKTVFMDIAFFFRG